MGIAGLLPMLKGITRATHVRELKGHRVAVDTYCWLHKGAFSASREICLGITTDRHVDYCMQRVSMLLSHGVIPVLVFDGGPLPSKATEEERRRMSRDKNLAKAVELEAQGDKAAFDFFQRSVDITPDLAKQLIEVLQGQGVEFVVAPYEADAQMAYLCRIHAVDAVITEDSDLIAYGCPRVLFKMDKFGACCEIRLSDIPENRDPSFAGFTPQMVTEMCILSGCDYLPSLPGVGLKKAHGFIQRFKSLQKAVRFMRFNGTKLPSDFEASLARAVWTFKYQRVYDPATQRLVHLEPLPEELVGQELDFLGPDLPPLVAQGVAEGRLNPLTLEPFLKEGGSSVSPLASTPGEGGHTLRQSGGWQGKGGIQFLERRKRSMSSPLPAQRNKLSKYFVPVSADARRQFQVPRTASPAAASVSATAASTFCQSSADLPPPMSKHLSSPVLPPLGSAPPIAPSGVAEEGRHMGANLRAFLASLGNQDSPQPCGPVANKTAHLSSLPKDLGDFAHTCRVKPKADRQPVPASGKRGFACTGQGVFSRLEEEAEDEDADDDVDREAEPGGGERSGRHGEEGKAGWAEGDEQAGMASGPPFKGSPKHEEGGQTLEPGQAGTTDSSSGHAFGSGPGGAVGGGPELDDDVERLLQGQGGPQSRAGYSAVEGFALEHEMLADPTIRRSNTSSGSPWTSLGAAAENQHWLQGFSPACDKEMGGSALPPGPFDFDDSMPHSPGKWEGRPALGVEQLLGFPTHPALMDRWGLVADCGGTSLARTFGSSWPGLSPSASPKSCATAKKLVGGVASPFLGLRSPTERLLSGGAQQRATLGLQSVRLLSSQGSPAARRRVLAPLSPNLEAGRWECSRQRSDQRPSENLSLHELQSRKCHPQPGPSGEAPNHLWADISEAGCSEASDVPARQAGHDDPKCPEGARVTGGGSSSSQQAAGCGEGGLPARRPSSTSSRFFGPHERLSSRRAAGGRVIPSAPDSVKGSAGAADSPPDEAGGAQVTGATHGTTAAVNHFSRHGTSEQRPSNRMGKGLATDLGHMEKYATVSHQALDSFEAKLRSFRHSNS